MMKLYLIALIGFCATEADNEIDSIRRGNSQFGYDISKLFAGSHKNVLFSPISAHAVLSMLYQGAGGSTKQALAAALHLPDSVQTAQAYGNVLNALNSDHLKINVSIVNKIYVKPGCTLKPEFRDIVENHFTSEVQSLDFSKNVETAKEINFWVEQKTNHKIHDIFQADQVGIDTHMVLVNALYFKGNWLNVFDKAATKYGKFYVDEVTTVSISMMFTTEMFLHKEDTEYGAEIVALPFENVNYTLFIILPLEKYGLDDLLRTISKDGNTLLTGLSLSYMDLTMPKFNLTETTDMQELLEKLGLAGLFDLSTCDLTNMFTNGDDVYISKAVQKTSINIDEFGCEAAATSGFVTVDRALPQTTVTVDHPFIIALVHKTPGESSDMLLIGQVVNPAGHVI